MLQKFSVIMSVYKNETADNLRLAFKSVVEQTAPPDEIVLVRDGKVPEALQSCIGEILSEYKALVTYIPLEENGGLGNALNIAINKARNDLIARMDTDDVCMPNRFELQLEAFEKNPDLDMVGGQVSEFVDDVEVIVGKREVPVSHSGITQYLKSRNAFNHPTVMYKKSKVIEAGNYIEMHFVEDYYLWLRMMINGCKFMNLPEVLVKMRVNAQMYQRRGGYNYYKTLNELEKYKKEEKITTGVEYLKNCAIRFCQCVLLPNRLRGWIYQKVLRK